MICHNGTQVTRRDATRGATGFVVMVRNALDHVPPGREELLCCRMAAWASENFPRGISYKRNHRGSVMTRQFVMKHQLPRALNVSITDARHTSKAIST